jgi:iron complex outermembrane receptor protein
MKTLLFWLCICICLPYFSQQTIQGKVLDAQTKLPVPEVTASLPTFQIQVKTNLKGEFILPLTWSDPQVLRLRHPDYKVIDTLIKGQGPNLLFEMRLGHMTTEEITVSGQAVSLRNKSTVPIEVRSITDLQLSGGMNVSELLTKIPGVYSSNLGNGIAKPVIRGMQGMRVVTLVNGLRLEGQQWGGDHGLGIGELALGSVELIKGPASVLYGADALGGVVYLVDEPYARINQQTIDVQQKWNQNTNGSQTSLVFKRSQGNKRLLLAGSYANHADFQLPNGRFAQNSRFHEWVFKGSYSWFKANQTHQFRYAFNNTVTGIPGHNEDTLLNPSIFQVADQKRNYLLPAQFFTNQLASYEFKRFWAGHEFNLLLGQTLNRLVEYDEVVTQPEMEMNLFNSLYQAKWTKKWSASQLIIGASGMLQYNWNSPLAAEQLLPNTRTFDQGVFSLYKVELSKRNFLQFGLRQDLRSIQTQSAVPSLKKTYASPNLSVGWSWQPSEVLSNQLNISSGFRAPHLSELLADGYHHGALRYEIGDTSLVPERSLQFDWSSTLNSAHGNITLNPFYAWVKDYIYLQPDGSTIGGLPVFTYRQFELGRLYGLDLSAHYHPHWLHDLHWEGNFSYINIKSGQDSTVSLLPPTRLQNVLKYQWSLNGTLRKIELSISHQWIATQNRVAFQEKPSQSYQLLHLNLRMHFDKNGSWVLQTGLRNLTNVTYIDHLSRLKNISMPGPGRHFYVSLKYQINQPVKGQS